MDVNGVTRFSLQCCLKDLRSVEHLKSNQFLDFSDKNFRMGYQEDLDQQYMDEELQVLEGSDERAQTTLK